MNKGTHGCGTRTAGCDAGDTERSVTGRRASSFFISRLLFWVSSKRPEKKGRDPKWMHSWQRGRWFRNWLWGLQARAVLALAASGHFCDLDQTRQTASSPNRTHTNYQLRATNARYHLQKDLSLKTRHWAVLKNSRSDYTSDLKRNAYCACPLEELQEAQLFLNTQRCSSMWRHTQGSVVSGAFTRDLTVS